MSTYSAAKRRETKPVLTTPGSTEFTPRDYSQMTLWSTGEGVQINNSYAHYSPPLTILPRQIGQTNHLHYIPTYYTATHSQRNRIVSVRRANERDA